MSYAITGAAIANCLGTDNSTVLDRAFAGTAAFAPANAYYDVPFATVLGVMPVLPSEGLACVMTRVAKIAFASVKQVEPAAHAAA